jgi:hypothetical protein
MVRNCTSLRSVTLATAIECNPTPLANHLFLRESDVAAERVALRRIARFVSAPQPRGALGAGAMREAVRHRALAGLLLQRIVADRRGSP